MSGEVIQLGPFLGETPALDPERIGALNAQIAKNCRLDSATLRPGRGMSYVRPVSRSNAAVAIFRYTKNLWFEWAADVDAVRASLDDAYDRVIFTGLGAPKVTYNAIAGGPGPVFPDASYKLGIPAPDAPSVILSGTPDNPDDLAETRYYVCTYLDGFGGEGPPSLPSGKVDWKPGLTPTLTLPGPPSAETDGAYFLKTVRIYRLNTGASGSSLYQRVADVALATASFDDTVADADLGEALSTETYDLPPKNLRGLVALPGGYFAGFYDNVLCFSEPGAPHAWPVDYRLLAKHDIVGLGVFGNTIVVTTKGTLHLATGADPAGTSLNEVPEAHQSCTSKRSIARVGEGIVYASPDGLVYVTATGAPVITRGVFRREQWQTYKPSSMLGVNYEGGYLCFYDNGTSKGALAVNPTAPQTGVLFTDLHVQAAYEDLEEDQLYVIDGTDYYTWHTGDDLTLTWRSKVVRMLRPVNLSAAKVFAKAYPVQFTLFADGVQRFTKAVTGERAFRLPAGYRAERYEVELSGTTEIVRVALAHTVRDLAEV